MKQQDDKNEDERRRGARKDKKEQGEEQGEIRTAGQRCENAATAAPPR